MYKKITILFFSFLTFFLSILPVQANENINLHLFWADGCPHCAQEKLFLETLTDKYPELNIQDYEVTRNTDNANLLQKVGAQFDADVSGVPFTVIGDQYVVGYLNQETSGQKIEQLIQSNLDTPTSDIVSQVKSNNPELQVKKSKKQADSLKIDLPLIGTISSETFSLPILTIIIALLDGFNPCAMWVLLFLISLLLNMQDKKRMWLLGSSFIATSAIVYFLFLTAWLNFFLVIGFIPWIRLGIGLFAIGIGAYQLNEVRKKQDVTCKVVDADKRQMWFSKMRSIVAQKELLLAVLGIMVLAVAVNLVELVCSAGLPAIYTQVLALSQLSAWKYYGLLFLYILIFMLDDMIIFGLAMTTLQASSIGGKYAHYSHIVGGALVFLLGILLVFKPGWLMFG